jgi:ribosomal protein RSM22 (predicted rRNA methylase)
MEKYLNHEPQMKLCKKARLPTANRRSTWGDLFSPTKSTSVDDILAIKDEINIKREISDQVNNQQDKKLFGKAHKITHLYTY